jgi:hypothetical protein
MAATATRKPEPRIMTSDIHTGSVVYPGGVRMSDRVTNSRGSWVEIWADMSANNTHVLYYTRQWSTTSYDASLAPHVEGSTNTRIGPVISAANRFLADR